MSHSSLNSPSRRSSSSRPPHGARRLLAVALLAAGLLSLSCGGETRYEPVDVNVILITMDTTRPDYLGCHGNTAARTPHIDRLAREGTRFTRATACTPLTLPSHSTIMTGKYPFAHGVHQDMLDKLGEEHVTLAEALEGSGYWRYATIGSVDLRRRFGLAQGFRWYNEPGMAKKRKADEVTDAVIAELGNMADERFFWWVHYNDPHFPYESARNPDVTSLDAYADEIAFMDEQIGRLLQGLENAGIADETLIILVGDHGEGLGEHGEAEHGFFVYDTTLRVPLVVWGPGIVEAGHVVDARVGTVDVMPTILDFLGLPIPVEVQGRSLRPLLAGKRPKADVAYYSETMAPAEVFGLTPLQVLYEGDWKYVSATQPLLYDLASDPQEERDLAAGQPERVAAMDAALQRLLAVGAGAMEGEGETVELSERELQQLRSLGYVGGSTSRRSKPASATTVGPDYPAAHAASIDRYVQAQRLIAAGQYAEAGALLRAVVLEMPGAPHPMRDLALVLTMTERENEIEPFCREVIAAHPDASGMRFFLAQFLMRQKRYAEAAEELEQVVTLDPENAAAHSQLGHAFRALGRLDGARSHYTVALGLDPDDAATHHGLAMVCVREEKWQQAVDHLRTAVALQPDSERFRRELNRVVRLRELER